YCPGENFVAITKLFIKAKTLLESGQFTSELAQQLDAEVQGLHPVGRGLDTGFYDFDPKTVK
ncbi:TPA: U32 family peptidase, partial [Streptococcus equi subsp. zooepidemicus]|nr:U32 family peptidase [Streptococcus equi subsp. zooepidemicus]